MQSHWQVVDSGKIRVSNTPEELWSNAAGYFAWCDANPIKHTKTITSGKEVGKKVESESPRPYSIKGLCLHCGILEEYIRDVRQTKDKVSLYYVVVSKILYIIYIQNLELATVGVFNPIFVSKVLNMEKDDTPASGVKIEIVGGLPELSKTENEILDKLERENGLA